MQRKMLINKQIRMSSRETNDGMNNFSFTKKINTYTKTWKHITITHAPMIMQVKSENLLNTVFFPKEQKQKQTKKVLQQHCFPDVIPYKLVKITKEWQN